jgi:hypothetical protein
MPGWVPGDGAPPRLMYDSTNVMAIPADATLVAGYYSGAKVPTTLPALRERFPHATIVDICVTASQNGTVLDVESGDARPEQVPAWVTRQRSLGRDPTVYTSTTMWPQVVAACQAAKVAVPHWWRAHYNGAVALEMGEIAHQYTNGVTPTTAAFRVPGCDTSVVAAYWPGVDPAPATPTPQGSLEADVFELIHNTVTGQIVAWSAGGAWWPVPSPAWAQVALADSVLCRGQRDVGQAEFDLLNAIAASARS